MRILIKQIYGKINNRGIWLGFIQGGGGDGGSDDSGVECVVALKWLMLGEEILEAVKENGKDEKPILLLGCGIGEKMLIFNSVYFLLDFVISSVCSGSAKSLPVSNP